MVTAGSSVDLENVGCRGRGGATIGGCWRLMGSPHLFDGLLHLAKSLIDRRESFGGVGVVSSYRRHCSFRRVHLLFELSHFLF